MLSYSLGLCTWISTCSFRANLRVICGHSAISINSENEQESTSLLNGTKQMCHVSFGGKRDITKSQVVKSIQILISVSTLSYRQHLPGNDGVWLFFFFFIYEFPLIWNFFLLRSKRWVHSMASDCSGTLLISKFQPTISTLLWVSKWNTLIKLECLALFQTWELDHAGFNGGSIFCLV